MELLDSPQANGMCLESQPVFDENNQRIYIDFESGKWLEEKQKEIRLKLQTLAVVLGLIFYSDGAEAQGKESWWWLGPEMWSYHRSTHWWYEIVMGSWVHEVPEWKRDQHYVEQFRLSYPTFMDLCQQLSPHIMRQDTKLRDAIPVELRVAVAVYKLAHGTSYRQLGIRCYEVTQLMEDHKVSLDTIYSLRDLNRDQGEALMKRWRVAAATAAWAPHLRPAQQLQLLRAPGLAVVARPPSKTSNHRR
ncbi:hypothetical protein WJX77_002390 [Trebouxia sp. C0004]